MGQYCIKENHTLTFVEWLDFIKNYKFLAYRETQVAQMFGKKPLCFNDIIFLKKEPKYPLGGFSCDDFIEGTRRMNEMFKETDLTLAVDRIKKLGQSFKNMRYEPNDN